MGNIPNVTSLRSEDFPSQQEWISRLLFPLNQFMTAATQAINGNINFGENVPCQTISLKFTYGSSADFPKLVKWQQAGTPIELRVCSAFEDNVAIGVLASWYYSNGQIYITELFRLSDGAVSALVSESVYNITLRAQP